MKKSNHIDIMLIIISKSVLVYDEKHKPNPNTPALTPNCRTKMSFLKLVLTCLLFKIIKIG